ncbi:hypothetical protein A2229_00940 [Candidatus Peregrinibacteria bacterium RIFOXYA2_FULL_33_7]|nr:MAG: hypothetical protein A2229_00940 [Candidatus Peregrinibacteria bacterium RIFOXYA2_FULL_33_7]
MIDCEIIAIAIIPTTKPHNNQKREPFPIPANPLNPKNQIFIIFHKIKNVLFKPPKSILKTNPLKIKEKIKP